MLVVILWKLAFYVNDDDFMIRFTFVDFLEALIISLVELSRRQEWEERYSTFLALSDLFPCWIRALRNNNGDYEGRKLNEIDNVDGGNM